MDNYFNSLYAVDLSSAGKVKQKNGLNYVSWASAWAEVKKMFPDATYHDYEQPGTTIRITMTNADGSSTISESTSPNRFWFDDGNTGWVKVGVKINGIEHVENFPILDHRNKSIPADQITSYDANRAKMRALAKACGKHGLGLYIYEGEDIPEDTKKQKTALETAHAAIVNLCRRRTEKDGIDKEVLYSLISEMNDGNRNPNSIPTVELCEEITKAIKAVKKEQ